MDTEVPLRDCQHHLCRYVDRALALGRSRGGRCRRWQPSEAAIVTLDLLGRGQAGRVIQVGGRPAVRRRLMELGLVRGETITFQRAAPLGDPVEYVVKGYHLSLRRREAASVIVETLARADDASQPS